MSIADLQAMIAQEDDPIEDWSLDGLRLELERYWCLANDSFFGGVLEPVVFTFAPTRSNNLGHYLYKGWSLNGKTKDEVNLNPMYFERPITEKLVTLVHEAAHQWQQITGAPSKNPKYHNKAFRAKLDEIGIPCDVKGCTTSTDAAFLSWVEFRRPAAILEPHRSLFLRS